MATNSAFMKPMTISPELAIVVGAGPMPRSEVVKALWVYIKKHNLQNPSNKRNILADEITRTARRRLRPHRPLAHPRRGLTP